MAVEQLLTEALRERGNRIRAQRDLDIIDKHVEELNREAADVLDYQVDL